MDKNPRQITRLRYLDARNLEKFVNSLTYESDTNTFEIGTGLFVDGKATFNSEIVSQNGGGLYLYDNEGGNENVNIYADVSGQVLYINYNNSDNIDLDVTVQIPLSHHSIVLTNANTKTLFGNQSLEGSGNIDLYNHIISIDINSTILLNIFVKASSSNVKVNSLNDLTTLLKAKENTIIECNAYNAGQTYTRNVDITGLIYTNSTWKYGLVYMTPQGPFIDNEVLITTATINDVVTTI